MSKRLTNQKHLMWVRTLPCFISRSGFLSCNGSVQAHHLLKPKSGFRGFSLKAHDSECIPLCMFHHSQLHVKFGDEFKFFEYYGFRKTAGQEYAQQLYNGNQNWIDKETEDDLPF